MKTDPSIVFHLVALLYSLNDLLSCQLSRQLTTLFLTTSRLLCSSGRAPGKRPIVPGTLPSKASPEHHHVNLHPRSYDLLRPGLRSILPPPHVGPSPEYFLTMGLWDCDTCDPIALYHLCSLRYGSQYVVLGCPVIAVSYNELPFTVYP